MREYELLNLGEDGWCIVDVEYNSNELGVIAVMPTETDLSNDMIVDAYESMGIDVSEYRRVN